MVTGSTVLHEYIAFMNSHVNFDLDLQILLYPTPYIAVPISEKKTTAMPLLKVAPDHNTRRMFYCSLCIPVIKSYSNRPYTNCLFSLCKMLDCRFIREKDFAPLFISFFILLAKGRWVVFSSNDFLSNDTLSTSFCSIFLSNNFRSNFKEKKLC